MTVDPDGLARAGLRRVRLAPWLTARLRMTTWPGSCRGSSRSSLPAALKSFRIHAGFRLEPVAVEPLVTDPVSVCYDADGRLYVVEMRGYPYPEKTPSGNVTRLEDRDGDGRFETRTIFVDGLSWPTGIVPYDGGVFIAVAPESSMPRTPTATAWPTSRR